MTFEDQIINEYFDWMYDYVCNGRAHDGISYKKLFAFLYDTEFTYDIDNDENRAYDGISLRERFANTKESILYDDILYALDKPCSVLEMILALSIRCEEQIMTDTRYGDRIKQWFWTMLKNLGLNLMTDDVFDKEYAEQIINRFLKREYSRNGRGGLFYIPDCEDDLRQHEIWTQLCWFLNTF